MVRVGTVMPRYDRNNGVRVLYPKTEIIQVSLTPAIKDAWLRHCEETGIPSAEYVRLLMDLEIDRVLFRVESKSREK